MNYAVGEGWDGETRVDLLVGWHSALTSAKNQEVHPESSRAPARDLYGLLLLSRKRRSSRNRDQRDPSSLRLVASCLDRVKW